MIDAVVLGAGPAGAAVAIALRRLGARVVIVDPLARRGRRRVGETFHPGIEPLLEHLSAVEALRVATLRRHAGTWVVWGGEPRYAPLGGDTLHSWSGFHVSRGRFDGALLDRAQALGAGVLLEHPRSLVVDGDRVLGVRLEHHTLLCGAVFDCSGASRWLGRQLDLPFLTRSRRLGAHHGLARGPVSAALPRVASDGEGWTWIAQVEQDMHHWTRVTPLELLPPKGWRPSPLERLQPEHVACTEVTWYRAQFPGGPGWYLCGEASYRIDPIIGSGVLRAISTAMMAAHSFASGQQEAYSRWWEAQVTGAMDAATSLYERACLGEWLSAPYLSAV